MNRRSWVRSGHRWLSMLFTATVLANFVVRGFQPGEPSPWITYAPLPPLFLLMLTGLTMFFVPYIRGRRFGAADE